jgi:hypothetical protein
MGYDLRVINWGGCLEKLFIQILFCVLVSSDIMMLFFLWGQGGHLSIQDLITCFIREKRTSLENSSSSLKK